VTNRSRVLLEKLIVAQLAKKLSTFFGIRRFIPVFRIIHHQSIY